MKIHPALLATPMALVFRLWAASLRKRGDRMDIFREHQDKKIPAIACTWHEDLFSIIALSLVSGVRPVSIISQSRDGELITRVAGKLGITAARGSSSRGGMKALKAMRRHIVEQGMTGSITVDGPRGPRRKVKEGAIYLAHKIGARILPVRASVKHKKTFNSWDKFQLPMPFTRVDYVFGEPYSIQVERMTSEILKQECLKLEEILNGLV